MRAFISVVLFSLFALHVSADEKPGIAKLSGAAATFLKSLDADQRKTTQLPFAGDTRLDWHYVPKNRKGLRIGDMTPQQKGLAWAVFTTALSETGHKKVKDVIERERRLWQQSNKADFRDPGKYHVTIFGDPKANTNWGASLEGHHLSINLTIVDGGEIYVTPSFLGANPERVDDQSDLTTRPLAGEADKALALFAMLPPDERKRAVISDKSPREIITGADRKVSANKPQGLSASAMDAAQKGQLLAVINEYLGRYRKEFAEDDLAKIEKAGIDAIHFAWAGDAEPGKPMYYRIQGPTFLIEYVNFQNGANHAHTVWRDLENDFGTDALKNHVETDH